MTQQTENLPASDDRSSPPSDELMAKVVAEWKGWDDSVPVGRGLWNDSHMLVQGKPPYANATHDPRIVTDAALELLHHCLTQGPNAGSLNSNRRGGWQASYAEHIPVSDQPFRTAVCWLAVDVLGVAEAAEGGGA
jgi:hypothetical protein